jgi:hypothetical protein
MTERLRSSDRLAKLIRLLASDQAGEVVAAAAAIKRALAAEGTDLNAFADALIRPQPTQEPRPPPREANWHRVACECQARSNRLSQREQAFIDSIVDWTALRPPTERQAAWLTAIYRRLRCD